MMVRICGYIINTKKKVYVALSSIYGVGQSTAKKICKELGVDYEQRLSNLEYDDIYKISNYIRDQCLTGEDLKKYINNNKRDLYSINSYRGKRLSKGLPCRGQRTRSNHKTAKKHNKIITGS